jgi:hypothetical protein
MVPTRSPRPLLAFFRQLVLDRRLARHSVGASRSWRHRPAPDEHRDCDEEWNRGLRFENTATVACELVACGGGVRRSFRRSVAALDTHPAGRAVRRSHSHRSTDLLPKRSILPLGQSRDHHGCFSHVQGCCGLGCYQARTWRPRSSRRYMAGTALDFPEAHDVMPFVALVIREGVSWHRTERPWQRADCTGFVPRSRLGRSGGLGVSAPQIIRLSLAFLIRAAVVDSPFA